MSGNLRGWLLYTAEQAARNQAYIAKYMAAADKHHAEIDLVIDSELEFGFFDSKPSVMLRHEPAALPDFIINRTSDPWLGYYLERLALPVYNSSFVSDICLDKRKTMLLAAECGIPVMPSMFVRQGQLWPMRTELHWQGPIVVKPVNGSGGKDVILLRSEEEYEAARVAEYRKQLGGHGLTRDLIFQQAASDLGRDLRVYAIGSHIEAAMLRCSDPETDFRSNYCLGGQAIVYDLSHHEKAMIKQILSKLNCGLVGIDFIFDQGQAVFNEIEDAVGARMLYSHTDVDIAERYLEYIFKDVRRGWLTGS
ncbi:MAG: ATP-grasp domain-containing protein [Eubacteriales bacterium]|nr:ATP-grasp domain-containing protein [Eubacteriales bacterium]MDD3197700.1 ATP-grasp domain-containing protein [Eubacteriales bacterium]MDD3503590.1 ATP-grasp domain-containing protein [Eubacteriales bacterium]MDD4682587.1 ATP-grasp domain-containing protein [Eubacteriales bacterium]